MVDEDLKKELVSELSKEFATNCKVDDLEKKINGGNPDIIKQIDQPCEDPKNCALHSKINDIKKMELLKGVTIGKKLK